MPSSAYGIGQGIEKGVNNFLQSFFAAKQYKAQEKYRKLQPILEVLHEQITNPNTPLDMKMKAIDSLPHLLGSYKQGDVELSKHFGLDKLAAQMQDTGDVETTRTPSKNIIDQNAVDFNNQQNSLPQQPSGDNSDGTIPQPRTLINPNFQTKAEVTKKSILKRRGELSDSDVQLIKQKSLFKQQQADEFTRQYQLATLQAEQQAKVLATQGWKNNDDWSLDQDSNQWQQNWFNPITKESYVQKLPPNVVPIGVIQKQIQASGSGQSGVTKAYTTLEHSIALNMGLEDDDPRVKVATAKLWKDNFEAGVDYKRQGVLGTRKIQPGQREGLDNQQIAIQQKHSELVASAEAAHNIVNDTNDTSLAKRKGIAHQETADAKQILDGLDIDLEDSNYKAALQNYNNKKKYANELETQYQKAVAEDTKLAKQVEESQKNLRKSGMSDSPSSNLSPRMQVRIKTFRSKNPSFNGTDEQAAEILKAAGFNE